MLIQQLLSDSTSILNSAQMDFSKRLYNNSESILFSSLSSPPKLKDQTKRKENGSRLRLDIVLQHALAGSKPNILMRPTFQGHLWYTSLFSPIEWTLQEPINSAPQSFLWGPNHDSSEPQRCREKATHQKQKSSSTSTPKGCLLVGFYTLKTFIKHSFEGDPGTFTFSHVPFVFGFYLVFTKQKDAYRRGTTSSGFPCPPFVRWQRHNI